MGAHLTWVDLVILFYASLGLLRGTRQGLFRQIAGIFGILAGFYCGLFYWRALAGFLANVSDRLAESSWLGVLAFFICLGGVVFLATILGGWLDHTSSWTLTLVSKWLGGMLGISRAIFEIIILFAVVGIFKPVIAFEAVADSIFAVYFAALSLDFISLAWPLIPEVAQKLIFSN